MKKIRLIALDVDGTLLNDAKQLPEENRAALAEAAAQGVVIAIASGRMTPTIEPIAELLGIDCVIIAYNGGKVVAPRAAGRTVLHHEPVPSEVSDVFVKFAHEKGYLLNFYHDDRLYAEDGPRRRPFMEIYSSRTGAQYHIDDNFTRFYGVQPTKLILMGDPSEIDELCVSFRESLGSKAYITKTDLEYLEVMAPGVDKGSALQVMASYYGFTVDEVLAVGDADNDVGMLRAAGLGVAVQNAGPAAKAGADVVTESSNNDSAVAEAVRRWVLS
jgi:Cof subfamily protein (haloacid dehalogenase superfamily)